MSTRGRNSMILGLVAALVGLVLWIGPWRHGPEPNPRPDPRPGRGPVGRLPPPATPPGATAPEAAAPETAAPVAPAAPDTPDAPAAPATPTAPEAAATHPRTSAKDLLAAGERFTWTGEQEMGLDEDGEEAVRSRTYDSRAGRIVLPVPLGGKAVRAALAACVLRVRTDELTVRSWRWQASEATGGHLRSEDGLLVVLPDVTLRLRVSPVRERERQKQAVGAAAARLVRTLEQIERTGGISPWMAGALRDLLGRLDDKAGRPHLAELDAQFARRVVGAGGWLAAVAPQIDAGARQSLEAALADSRRLSRVWQYAGGDVHYEGLEDAWGPRGEVLRRADATLYVRTPPHPMDAGSRMAVLRTCRVVAVLPAGADPLARPDAVAEVVEARLVRNGAVLAAWSRDEGFQADLAAWRKHFPAPKPSYLRDGWPPHVPLMGPDEYLRGVAVPAGLLVPVADDSDAEAERFLSDAARLLRDAAHLDLLQQYFLRYVSDSPDLTLPTMIGCEAFHDEIHQTADQILDTCAAGICRGDCDDVAEFIQTIARRQGRLAHVVSLPGHLAAVWGEQHGKEWRVYVMQSGPSHEYRHAELPKALEQAYLDLDPNAPFDRNGLSVSLRFDGQNTREVYRLSWRIFGDAEYADTMIDVQADWNRMTLLRAEQKMLKIIEAGDDSNANYGEIAGLCGWTDQHEKALRYSLETLKRRKEPESRLLLSIEIVGHHMEAKQTKEAEALALDILQRQLPALVPQLGLRALVIGIGLADTLTDDLPLRAAEAMAWVAETKIEAIGGSLREFLKPDHKPQAWREHGESEGLQDVMDEYAGSAQAILRELKSAEQRGHPAVGRMLDPLQVWLRDHLFDDVTDPEQIASSWTYLARLYGAALGKDVAPQVAAAPMPTKAQGLDHAQLARASGRKDLFAWAHASPWFACNELAMLVADKKRRPDPKRVRLLARLLDEGERAAVELGIHGPDADAATRKARIRVALLTQDEALLRRLLREVKGFDDRYVYESISSAMAWATIHLHRTWWERAFQIWVEEVDNRVNYFNFVWRARGVGAPAHALHVAEVAAKRFPDDDAIQEEVRLLRAFLSR